MNGKCPDCGGPIAWLVERDEYACRDCKFSLTALAREASKRRSVSMDDLARAAQVLPRPVGSKDAALRRKFYVSPYTREDE